MFRWRRRKQSDFSAELEAHLQLEADRLKEQGLGDEEALLTARRAFGNPTGAQERFYESQRWRLLTECRQDVRFGLRLFAKNPGSTAVAVLALALGIGMNTAIFSVMNAALLKFLPVHNPNELVMLTDPNASEVLGGTLAGKRTLATYTEFVELRDHTKSMSGLCASQMMLWSWPVSIPGHEQETVHGRLVSENYFSVFGVQPAAGRFFTQQDATGIGKDPYVVISYDYWRRRFGGNPAVVGTPMRFYRSTFTIIGVAAKGFRGETVTQDPDLWLPMFLEPIVIPISNGSSAFSVFMDKDHDKFMWLHVFGRRKAGVTVQQVQAEVSVLFRRILEADYPPSMEAKARKNALNQQIAVTPVRAGAFHGRNEFSEQWTVLSVLAALVLLIACANVANLLLARATVRSREVAIRLSIGAARGRLIRQFLTESLLLAALGGIAGLCVAEGALRLLLLALSRSSDSMKIDAHLDPRVLGFTACATLLTGILFGLAPALRSARVSVNQSLRQRVSLPKTLVAAQVALSFVLVMGAGLFLRTLWNLQSVSLGYPPENLLLVTVNSYGARNQTAGSARRNPKLTDSLRRIPGVRAVTYSGRGLFTGFDGAVPVWIKGFKPHGDADIAANDDSVGPAYFSTIGIPMLLGRDIDAQDTIANAPPVCVINEAFAKHFFGKNPVGMQISSIGKTMQVIGVAKDSRVRSLRDTVDPKLYKVEDETGSWDRLSFEIRTAGDPKHLLDAVRKAILTVDADLTIESTHSVNELVDEQNAQPRLIAQLCTLFGLIALVLAATGIYGVLSYSVARRTNEIGIRMALGAGKNAVTGMILQETGLIMMTGMVAGVAAAAVLAKVTAAHLYGNGPAGSPWSIARYEAVESATQLYGLRAMDPFTIAVAIGILWMAGLVAAYLPAARAARVDPMNALRHD
ncbi:MAG TPA: ABC transporter permease [Bryobacteraceae bacterium]|jgi:predicted permease